MGNQVEKKQENEMERYQYGGFPELGVPFGGPDYLGVSIRVSPFMETSRSVCSALGDGCSGVGYLCLNCGKSNSKTLFPLQLSQKLILIACHSGYDRCQDQAHHFCCIPLACMSSNMKNHGKSFDLEQGCPVNISEFTGEGVGAKERQAPPKDVRVEGHSSSHAGQKINSANKNDSLLKKNGVYDNCWCYCSSGSRSLSAAYVWDCRLFVTV